MLITMNFYSKKKTISSFNQKEKLYLLNNHPLFTGVCPRCKFKFAEPINEKEFQCPQCGCTYSDNFQEMKQQKL